MIQMFKVRMSDQASLGVIQTLGSGMIGEGPRVAEFKQKLEERFKCKNLILLNSGTSALTLALRLAGVEGGEVITTPFTMIATNVAILAERGKVVFADIEENSVSISAESIKSKINRHTKAIVVTCVGGIPPDLEMICSFGVPVIIDAAHAIDTYYKGKHISQWGDYVCFSFQSIKQLTTGDGGAIVIKRDDHYRLAEKLKWFGMTRNVPEGMTRLEHQMTADVTDWGYKFHMNDIAATIGLANLPLLDDTSRVQNENAEYYLTHLEGLPSIPMDCRPSWWAFYIFVENRTEVIKRLAEMGIETTPMWRRNDEYSVFKDRLEMGEVKHTLPNMDRLQDKILFIPVGWWVTESERSHIVESIKLCLK